MRVIFFAFTIPFAAKFADRHGRRRTMLFVSGSIALFGFFMAPLLTSGTAGALTMLIIGLGLMGLTYGPIGTLLSELFPTAVRYTGSSLTFNLAGIFGASLAPYLAMWLAKNHGLQFVGYYLTISALLTVLALWFTRETRDTEFSGKVERAVPAR